MLTAIIVSPGIVLSAWALLLVAILFVAWVYPDAPKRAPREPYIRPLSDHERREGLAALDEMGIRFGDPKEFK